MAGYFSNHSQSRFLVHPTNTNTATTTASTTAPLDPPTPAPALRTRIPSKHFSTSISSIDDRASSKEKVQGPLNGGPVGVPVHPLKNTWVFWFRQQRAPGNKITNYEEGIKKISAFSSVESFWSLWTHLHTPSALQPTTDYLLFHSGVRRPVWEDPLNLSGGKWIIRLKKGVTDRLWEELILAIIGEQFDDCCSGTENGQSAVRGADTEENDWPEICGCTISVRQSEDIVSVWNRIDGDMKVREKIRDTIRRVLNLPSSTIMEYKSNNDSMQDKSSFRNSAIDRNPLP